MTPHKQIYPWIRWWRPRDHSERRDGFGLVVPPRMQPPDDGRLSYPDANGPLVSTVDLLNQKPCLVLLGEPGMGKSQEMVGGFKALKSDGGDGRTPVTDQASFVDLKSIRSYERLIDRLLRGSQVDDWKRSDHYLDLFIDGFDECRLAIADLAEILLEELEMLPLTRLRLRIACRSAEWPKPLEDGLVRLFGNLNVGVYVLSPLTLGDVEIAVSTNKLDPEAFWSQVRIAGVTSLASRPIRGPLTKRKISYVKSLRLDAMA